MVEGVEGIHLEEEFEPFGEAEVLADGHIPVVDAWLAKEVAASVAIGAERRLGEAGGVESLERLGEIAMNSASLHVVGVLKFGAVQALNVVCGNAKRETGLKGCDTRQLPTAHREIGCAIDLSSEFFATSERQLPDVAANEALVYVEVGGTVIQIGVVVVFEALVAAASGADAGGC